MEAPGELTFLPTTAQACRGKDRIDHTNRTKCAGLSRPGALMTPKGDAISMAPSPLDEVALPTSLPENRLARGQIGAIVGDEQKVLVEFSDDRTRACAISPSPRSELLVMHYVPQAA
jgi:hypothetical protein